MTGVTDDGALLGAGVSFPPRIGADGRVVRSSGAGNIVESIRVILLTEPGERLLRPGFGGGLRDFLFEPNVPATHRLIQERIVFALGRWEPRIAVGAVTVGEDPDDERQAVVTIEYRLVATDAPGRVDLGLRLAG